MALSTVRMCSTAVTCRVEATLPGHIERRTFYLEDGYHPFAERLMTLSQERLYDVTAALHTLAEVHTAAA